MMRMKVKLTKGRQKIEMKPIGNKEARHVCFSKRRPILFKLASELSTLCGTKIAVVVFSPGGKPFSFGHPSVSFLIDRFLATDTLHGHAMGDVSHDTYGTMIVKHMVDEKVFRMVEGAKETRRPSPHTMKHIPMHTMLPDDFTTGPYGQHVANRTHFLGDWSSHS
ncbi:hypothetical protein EJB05_08446, partial [Eragrostis curvula]